MRFICFLGLLLVTGPLALGDEPKAPADAMDGWQNLRKTAADLEGKYRYERSVSVAGESKSATTEVREFGTSGKEVFLKDETDGVRKVGAANSEYVFEVDSADKKQPFILRQFRPGKEADAIRPRIFDRFEPFLFAGFEIVAKQLPDLVKSSRFSMQSLSEDKGTGIATMTFVYEKDNTTAITSGTVRFLMNDDWAIDSFNCITTWGKIDGKVRYKAFEGSFIPVSYEMHSFGVEDESVVHEAYELLDVRKLLSGEKLPVHLEDYGLAQPQAQVLQQKEGFRGWLIAINIALIVLLLGGYYAIRRKGQPSTSTES